MCARNLKALRHHFDDCRREHEPRTEGDEVFKVAALPVALHDHRAAKGVGSGSGQAEEQADEDGIHAEREYTSGDLCLDRGRGIAANKILRRAEALLRMTWLSVHIFASPRRCVPRLYAEIFIPLLLFL